MDSPEFRRTVSRTLEVLARVPITVEQLGFQVGALEELGTALEATGETWRNRFHEQWSALEEVYAVSLALCESEVTGDRATLVASAVSKLQALVGELEAAELR